MTLSPTHGLPGGGGSAGSAKASSLSPSQGTQPFVVYDPAEIEAVRREQAELDAALRSDLEAAVGPSKSEISNAWAEALMYISQNPGETVYVSHNIENGDLAALVNTFEQAGVIGQSEAVGTILTNDSSVTFAQGEEGWLFYRQSNA